MFILLVFTRVVTLVKTHQWMRSTWFVWMHRRVFVFLTEVSPGLMCFSVKSLEVLCKTIAGVVGEVLSVGKANCLGVFFFPHTPWPLLNLMSCSFILRQSSDLKKFCCCLFYSMSDPVEMQKLDWLRCMLTYNSPSSVYHIPSPIFFS